MKKIILVLIILLMCGCSKETKLLDLNNIKSNLENLTYEEKNMFENNEYYTLERLENKYGVKLNNVDEYIIYMPTLVTSSNMYFILSTNSKESLKKEMNELLNLIEKSWGNGYAPLEEKKVKERKEIEYGKYLIYIISDNNELVYDEIIK